MKKGKFNPTNTPTTQIRAIWIYSHLDAICINLLSPKFKWSFIYKVACRIHNGTAKTMKVMLKKVPSSFKTLVNIWNTYWFLVTVRIWIWIWSFLLGFIILRFLLFSHPFTNFLLHTSNTFPRLVTDITTNYSKF